MKFLKTAVISAVMFFGLSACVFDKNLSTTTTELKPDGTLTTTVTNVNNSDTHSWTKAYQSHVEQDTAKKIGMAQAISGSGACENCTDEGKAWSKAFNVMAIAYGDNFQSDEFTLAKPTNGYDIAGKVVDGVVDLGKTATYVTGGVELGKALIGGAGSSIQMGDNGSVEGSFNNSNVEAHATAANGDPTTTMLDPEDDPDNYPVEENVTYE